MPSLIQSLSVDELKRELKSRFPGCHPTRANPRSTPKVTQQTLRAGRGPWPTGITTVDALLPGGGFPGGRLSEITGPSSSGKLMTALSCAAQATQAGHPIAWVDLACTFYPPSAHKAGVALQRLLILKPKDITQALKAVDILIRGRAFPLIILDWGLEPAKSTINPEVLGTAIARLNGLLSMGSEALLMITTPQTARDAIRYYATIRLGVERVPFQTLAEEAARGHAPPKPSPDHPTSPSSSSPQGSKERGAPHLRLLQGEAPPPSTKAPLPAGLINGPIPEAAPPIRPWLLGLTEDGAISPWGMSAPQGGVAIGGRPKSRGSDQGPLPSGGEGSPSHLADTSNTREPPTSSLRRSSAPSPQHVGARSAFDMVKNKLGAPGSRGEVNLEPWDEAMLPLHSGRLPSDAP